MAISFRKFLEGIRIIPKTTSTASEQGDLDVTLDEGKLNYHNGQTVSPVVTESHTAVLTNKVISGDENLVQNLSLTSLKLSVSDSNKVIRRNAAGTVISGNALPNSSEIVTVDSSTALTNKTLTSPVLNTPTSDTITGIAGNALTIQSASNQTLSLQAQGTGVVQLESVVVDGNTLTGGASTFTVRSASNQNLSLQAQGTGVIQLESIAVDTNTVTGGASTFTLQSASNQNFIIQAQGTGQLQFPSKVVLSAQTDSVTTGSNATLASPTKSYIQLTNGSLASVDGIPAGSDGQLLILSNRTGTAVAINNETGGSTTNQILTGTGSAIPLSNNASLTLVYNATASRWMIVGGISSGGGGGGVDLRPAIADIIVGSAAQVASGLANYSTISAAITAATAGQKILVLSGSYSENVTVSKRLYITGNGRDSLINGTFTLAAGSDYSLIKCLKIGGNMSLISNNSFATDCWLANSATISDTGISNSVSIIQE